MKRTSSGFGFLMGIAVLLLGVQDMMGQLRNQQPSPFGYSGTIFRAPAQADASGKLLGLFKFNMSHSYQMTMGSMGGTSYNQNFYTNTMYLQFNDQLQGRVDLSVAHSPFGNGLMNEPGGARFFVRNAELNYQISPKTNLHLQFQQLPYSPYGMYGNPYGRYRYDPFYPGF